MHMVGACEKWLVTGAAGFVGSNLVQALLLAGQEVVGLDDLSNSTMSNLESIKKDILESDWERFRLIRGDIQSLESCMEACSDVDIVLHQAAVVSVPRSVADPIRTNAVNVTGFLNLLMAAKEKRVGRVVYASSSSVYGDSAVWPRIESSLGKTLSPYASSKLIGECYARNFSQIYGMETIGLRYFNVFGPRQRSDGQYSAVIPRWIRACLVGDSITIEGDGLQTRDFCHIDSVVRANILAARTKNPLAIGQEFNIASGSSASINHVLNLVKSCLADILGVPVTVAEERAVARPFDIRRSDASIEKAKSILGYEVTTSFENGLRETVRWYADQFLNDPKAF